LWSWLPAFRAVAETQHLPTASQQLFVSASALSRTIRLLEEDLGQPLFLRHGRRIELNEAGQRLLVSVREAMRLVHESMLSLQRAELDGPVYVGVASPMLEPLVLGGVHRLRAAHPNLVPHVLPCADAAMINLLLRGQLDVVFSTRPGDDPELARLQIGRSERAIYCGHRHPLAAVDHATARELSEHGFVAIADARGNPDDGWPAEHGRRVPLLVGSVFLAIEACAMGELLAVLPVSLAEAPPHRDRLHRVLGTLVPPTPVFAHHRRTLTAGGRSEAVVDAVREVSGAHL
jgi:DNA-binding transcriptional LysR family regulator